jgi:NTP pyrophosphatase (non-canonical NTP hydrolase)
MESLEKQSAEFTAAAASAEQVRRHALTAVVDDDYPAVRHDYEHALGALIMAMRSNGRFDLRGHINLRSANIARQKEWDEGQQLSIEYFGNALAGEVGEACNVIKKLARQRLGLKGSTATTTMLADELADAVIYIDLIALREGINLDKAVALKFNATSEKLGFRTRMAAFHDIEQR